MTKPPAAQVFEARLIAGICLLIGLAGVISACVDLFSWLFAAGGSGNWHPAPFLPADPKSPWPFGFLFSLPRFLVTALVGIGLLWQGSVRWLGADISDETAG